MAMVPGWKIESCEEERLVIAYERSDPRDLEDWTMVLVWEGWVGAGEGSQYISVMVDATDDEDAAVL